MPTTRAQRRSEKELRSRLASEARLSNARLLRAVFDGSLATVPPSPRRHGQLAAALQELFAQGAEELVYKTAAMDVDVPALPAHVLLGYTREETLSPTVFDLVAGDMSVKIAEAWRTFHRSRGLAASSQDVCG